MEEKKVIYGGSKAYRRMCEFPLSSSETEEVRTGSLTTNVGLVGRYESGERARKVTSLQFQSTDVLLSFSFAGFFFRHPLLDQYDYYWVSLLFLLSQIGQELYAT